MFYIYSDMESAWFAGIGADQKTPTWDKSIHEAVGFTTRFRAERVIEDNKALSSDASVRVMDDGER